MLLLFLGIYYVEACSGLSPTMCLIQEQQCTIHTHGVWASNWLEPMSARGSMFWIQDYSLADLRGALGNRFPSRSNFFHFHTKFLPNNRLVHPLSHTAGRALTSDWSGNSFVLMVYENIFLNFR